MPPRSQPRRGFVLSQTSHLYVQNIRNPIKSTLLRKGCQNLMAHVTEFTPSLLISSWSEVQTAKSFSWGSFSPLLYRFARLIIRKVVEESTVLPNSDIHNKYTQNTLSSILKNTPLLRFPLTTNGNRNLEFLTCWKRKSGNILRREFFSRNFSIRTSQTRKYRWLEQGCEMFLGLMNRCRMRIYLAFLTLKNQWNNPSGKVGSTEKHVWIKASKVTR